MIFMFGLIDRDIEYIQRGLRKFEEINKAVIFGSRALGNYKKGSDVDIAIIGEGITSKTIYRLDDLLNEEYPLPYFFDILHYEDISNTNLKEHIDKYGKVIYSKTEKINVRHVIIDEK
jgi:predicted nucleotidyltransferase